MDVPRIVAVLVRAGSRGTRRHRRATRRTSGPRGPWRSRPGGAEQAQRGWTHSVSAFVCVRRPAQQPGRVAAGDERRDRPGNTPRRSVGSAYIDECSGARREAGHFEPTVESPTIPRRARASRRARPVGGRHLGDARFADHDSSGIASRRRNSMSGGRSRTGRRSAGRGGSRRPRTMSSIQPSCHPTT